VDRLTQVLGKAAMEDREYMLANVRRIRATRDRLCGELRALGFEIPSSQANFILARPPVPAAGLFRELRQRGFLVRYWDLDRVRDHIRITIGTESDMAAFVRTVAEILRG
jgi:histidinol-phosphate aminotransferase